MERMRIFNWITSVAMAIGFIVAAILICGLMVQLTPAAYWTALGLYVAAAMMYFLASVCAIIVHASRSANAISPTQAMRAVGASLLFAAAVPIVAILSLGSGKKFATDLSKLSF